jgi:cyclohexanecarboxylate-CoA ligase
MSTPLLDESSLWSLVSARARQTPDRLMLVDTRDRRITFGEFHARAEQVAAGLWEMGVRDGTRVAWQLPTTIETIVLSLALSRLGAIQIPIIHIYRQRELRFIAEETEAELVITRSEWRGVDYEGLAAEVAGSLLTPPRLLVLDDDLPEGDLSTLPDPPSPVDSSTGRPVVRWYYYTSGTTSAPKGVRHSDQTLLAGALALGSVIQATDQDVGSIAFPYAHIGGPDYIGMVLAYGVPAMVVEAFDPSQAVDLYRRHRVTLAGGTTAFYTALLKERRLRPDEPFIPTLRILVGGGAPKPPHVFFESLEEMEVPIVHGWAMTECPMICCGSVVDTHEQLAYTEGKPVPGAEVKVVDPGLDGVGRLYVRGTMLFDGYVDTKLNADVFDNDGWFDSGDLGYLRDDGHVVIAGRGKDVIIRKGETISAKEIEDVLCRHPKISDVAVIGVTDRDRGERVCAVIESAPAHDPLTLAELGEFCRSEELINQKIPEQLEIVDSLPRNATGKVAKNELRALFNS